MQQAYPDDLRANAVRAASSSSVGDAGKYGGAQIQREAAVRDNTPMEKSVEEAHKAVSELDAQVSELLAKLTPVCQVNCVTPGEGAEKGADESFSPLRGEIFKLRKRIQNVSTRIAQVRYTIEI